jgi:hypothetical protein
MENCVICLDDCNKESVFKNTQCSCNYIVHDNCWAKYVESKGDTVTCPTCRKHLTPKTRSALFQNRPSNNVTYNVSYNTVHSVINVNPVNHITTASQTTQTTHATQTTPLISAHQPLSPIKKLLSIAIGALIAIVICLFVFIAL